MTFCSLIAYTIAKLFFSSWSTPISCTFQISIYLAIIVIPINIVSDITKDFHKCMKSINKLRREPLKPIGPVFGGTKSYRLKTLLFIIICLIIQPKFLIEIYKLLKGESQQSIERTNIELTAKIKELFVNITRLLSQNNLTLANQQKSSINLTNPVN